MVYAQARGATVHSLLTELTSSKAYQSLSDAEKVEAVKKVYSTAADVAKWEILNLRGIESPESDTSAFAPGAVGLTDGEFYAVKGAAASIKAGLKNAKTDETIDNSKSLLIMEQVYALGLGLSANEYKQLFEELGVGTKVQGYSEKRVQTELTKMRKKAQQ